MKSKSLRILVVDNDLMFRSFMRDILNEKGYQVDFASDGKEALDKITRTPPDLLFVDLIMPKISGEQLIEFIRKDKELRHIRIAVLSGALEEYPLHETLGADYYVAKSDLDLVGKIVLKICRENHLGRKDSLALSPRFETEKQRRTIVEELLADRKKNRQTLVNLKEGVIIYDTDYKILDANNTATDLLGQPLNAILNTYLHDCFNSENKEKIINTLEQMGARRRDKISLNISFGEKTFDLQFSTIKETTTDAAGGGILLIYDLTPQKEIEGKLRRRVRELELLNQISQVAISDLSADELLSSLLEKSVEGLSGEAGTMALLKNTKDTPGDLVFGYTYGEKADTLRGESLKADEGILGWVVANNKSVIVHDVKNDKRFYKGFDQKTDFETRSILCAPLKSGEEIFGAIEILNKKEGLFNDDDKRLLDTIVNTTGLLLSKSRLQGIMNALSGGIMVLDRDLVVKDINLFFQSFLGKASQEIVGQKCHFVFYDSPVPCKDCYLKRSGIFEDGASFSTNSIYGNKTGDPCHFKISCSPLQMEGDTVSSVVLAFDDISESVRLQAYLQTTTRVASMLLRGGDIHENARDILRRLGDVAGASRCYWFKNRDGVSGEIPTGTFSCWCAEGFGQKDDDPEFGEFFYGANFSRWHRELSAGEIVCGNSTDLPVEERLALESKGICSILIVPVFVSGKYDGFLGLDQYAEERSWGEAEINLLHSAADSLSRALERERYEDSKKKLDAQLAQAQKMESIGTIASGVGHNFRNVLSGISVDSQLIQIRYYDDQEIRIIAKRIDNSVKKGARLVKRLMQFAREGDREKHKTIDLCDVIRDTYELVSKSFDKKIDMGFELPDSLPVKGDYSLLNQVFMNLCTNARDAMPEGGKLRIKGCVEGDKAVVIVSDNGSGMNREIQEKCFDPFFTTKEVDKGTGLGLSTAYGTVKEHGGEIHVYSEPNKGTSFRLVMPLSVDGEEKTQETQPKVVRGKGQRVLVVDDETELLKPMENILGDLGYQVASVDNGEEALAKSKSWQPDAVLLDRNMPRMDGIECMKKLIEQDPDCKIILVSGYDKKGPAGIDSRTQRLISGYITKPVYLVELAEKLARLFDEHPFDAAP